MMGSLHSYTVSVMDRMGSLRVDAHDHAQSNEGALPSCCVIILADMPRSTHHMPHLQEVQPTPETLTSLLYTQDTAPALHVPPATAPAGVYRAGQEWTDDEDSAPTPAAAKPSPAAAAPRAAAVAAEPAATTPASAPLPAAAAGPGPLVPAAAAAAAA